MMKQKAGMTVIVLKRLSIWRLDIYSLETRRMVMLVNSCYNNYMPIFAL